jgi:hypothetical protein
MHADQLTAEPPPTVDPARISALPLSVLTNLLEIILSLGFACLF